MNEWDKISFLIFTHHYARLKTWFSSLSTVQMLKEKSRKLDLAVKIVKYTSVVGLQFCFLPIF